MKTSLDQPILIVPKGVHPHPVLTQVIDSGAIQRIMNQLELWDRDIVVDYQHESMKQCGRAPAAGWVKAGTASVVNRGIMATIEWTQEARRLIESKEYRFVSPVFESSGGKITGLINLGLTNNPNLHGITPLINQLTIQESQMDLTSELKRLLGLDEAAHELDIVKALKELITQKGASAVSLNSILGDEKTAMLGLTAPRLYFSGGRVAGGRGGRHLQIRKQRAGRREHCPGCR